MLVVTVNVNHQNHGRTETWVREGTKEGEGEGHKLKKLFCLVGLGISDVSGSPANFVYRFFRSPGRVM